MVLGWFAFLGAFTFLAYTDFALIKNADWCGDGDKHCLRDWIGALSGWAAAFAAGITILVLYEQIREQRRQTAFALGEAAPTMSAAHPKDRMEDVVLRIVNWNRVPADILEVREVESSVPIRVGLREIRLRKETVYVDLRTKIENIVRIDGWEHRADAPSFAEIFAYVAADTTDIDADEVICTTFAVDLILYEDVPKKITLTAQINMLASEL